MTRLLVVVTVSLTAGFGLGLLYSGLLRFCEPVLDSARIVANEEVDSASRTRIRWFPSGWALGAAVAALLLLLSAGPFLTFVDRKLLVTGVLLLIIRHGYMLMFALLFAEAVGFPVPAAIALVAAGAAVSLHALYAPSVFLSALTALLLGDSVQFWLGRYMGWTLLGFLCRVSINPETCILRSAESFYRRGKMTLVIAKFIPGVNTMAAPLAGSMKMRYWQFLRLDFAGASLYLLTYLALGYVLCGFLASTLRDLSAVTRAIELAVFAAIVGYAIYRMAQHRKHRLGRPAPHVQVQELVARLASDDASRVQIVDVSSHGYYDAGAERIRGSIRIEPNNLDEEIKNLPLDRDIYLYCTSEHDATSARVARLLREKGFNTFVIDGGLTSWRKAGGPTEGVPQSDLVKLPTFS
jgi:membrane protein DedA with SNARE-associated domain/rhodanese-related sulfurtransferase